MKKIINEECINHLILPMTDEQALSLEGFLNEHVVEKRGKDEFVFVAGDDDLSCPTFLSYGLSEEDRYNLYERQAVEELIQIYGCQWMKNNGFLELH